MDINVVISVIVVGTVNVAIFSYGYGKLTNKVNRLCKVIENGLTHKVERLEIDMAVVKRNCQAFHGVEPQE